jgi:hypothetical protein
MRLLIDNRTTDARVVDDRNKDPCWLPQKSTKEESASGNSREARWRRFHRYLQLEYKDLFFDIPYGTIRNKFSENSDVFKEIEQYVKDTDSGFVSGGGTKYCKVGRIGHSININKYPEN